MKIIKFGGSSVGSPNSLQHVKEIIQQQINSNNKIVVVCSAFYNMTNLLLSSGNLAATNNHEYLNELIKFKTYHNYMINLIANKNNIINFLDSTIEQIEKLLQIVVIKKILDNNDKNKLLCFGEIISCNIISNFLCENGIFSKFVDASKLIKTKFNKHTEEVDFHKTNELITNFFQYCDYIPIVTGFIACNEDEQLTTLGRGGSDYTASILGSSLKAECIEIWTDVNGIMSVDPNFYSNAYNIKNLSYEEAIIFSKLGGKVIYTPTIFPAYKKNIPILIKNTFNKNHPGTLITSMVDNENNYHFISILENVFVISITKINEDQDLTILFNSLNIYYKLFFKKNNSIYYIFNLNEIKIDFKNIIIAFNNFFKNKPCSLSFTSHISLVSINGFYDINKYFTLFTSDNINIWKFKHFKINTVLLINRNELSKTITILHETFNQE